MIEIHTSFHYNTQLDSSWAAIHLGLFLFRFFFLKVQNISGSPLHNWTHHIIQQLSIHWHVFTNKLWGPWMELCFTNHEAPITVPNTQLAHSRCLVGWSHCIYLMLHSTNMHSLNVSSLLDSMVSTEEKAIHSLPVFIICTIHSSQTTPNEQVGIVSLLCICISTQS